MPAKAPLGKSLAIGVAILSAAALCGCGESTPKVEATVAPAVEAAATVMNGQTVITLPPNAKMDLEYGRAAVRTLDYDVTTTGEVLANANLMTHVTTPVTGRVTEVLVSLGERVQERQPLLIIRSNDIEQAEADLLNNENQVRADLKQALLQIDCDLNTAQAQVKLSESQYNRSKSLIEEQIASRADFEAAKTQFEKDKIAVNSLIHKREATIALANEKMKVMTEPNKQKLRVLGLEECAIEKVMRTHEVDPSVPVLSPESGLISERGINVGELADPSKPLFTIGNFNTVWIKADIHEKDVAKIECGQPITLELDSFPGVVFHGKLNYVADSISPDTRTLSVRAEVQNPGLKLKPKMFARMNILVGEHPSLCVPKDAIQDAGSTKVVYVPVGNGRFEERNIKTGAEIGPYVEVTEGLKPGEDVVTKGSFELRSQSLKASS